MKTDVAFHATGFNCTEPRDHFINPGCFGDDLCTWLIARLRAAGVATADGPAQEDFGWYFTFTAGGVDHCFVVGFQPNEPLKGDRWIGSIERHAGFVSSLLGGRRRSIAPAAVEAIDAALKDSPNIRNVTWHEPGTDADDDAPEE